MPSVAKTKETKKCVILTDSDLVDAIERLAEENHLPSFASMAVILLHEALSARTSVQESPSMVRQEA